MDNRPDRNFNSIEDTKFQLLEKDNDIEKKEEAFKDIIGYENRVARKISESGAQEGPVASKVTPLLLMLALSVHGVILTLNNRKYKRYAPTSFLRVSPLGPKKS